MSQKTYMYDTQWQALINAIDGGDTSAIATALGQIKTSIDSIETALGSLSADVTQDSTQWTNLINAITNQSLVVDLSNITSDVVSNESTVIPADTVTEALDVLKSDLNGFQFKDITNSINFNTDYIGARYTQVFENDTLVILSLNFRIDATVPSYTGIISNLPLSLARTYGSMVGGGTSNRTIRLAVDGSAPGTAYLASEDSVSTGWYNGNMIYIKA